MESKIADDTLSSDYHRRTRLYRRVNWLIIAGAIAVVVWTVSLLSESQQLAVLLPLALVTFTIVEVFSSVVWRCPSCRIPFTRAHRGCACEHCGIQFRPAQLPTNRG